MLRIHQLVSTINSLQKVFVNHQTLELDNFVLFKVVKQILCSKRKRFSLQVFESVLYLGNPVIIFRQHRYRETMPLMNEIKLIIIEILTKTDLYCDVIL